MQSTGITPAKYPSGATVNSPQAAIPTNKAASLAFLMSLDHSAAILNAKPAGIPKGTLPIIVAVVASAPPTIPAVSKTEHPVIPQQSIKSVSFQAPTATANALLKKATEVIKAAPSRIVTVQASAAVAAGASAGAAAVIRSTPGATQSGKVRQRSEDDISSSPTGQVGSPLRSSLAGPEPKKQKASR